MEVPLVPFRDRPVRGHTGLLRFRRMRGIKAAGRSSAAGPFQDHLGRRIGPRRARGFALAESVRGAFAPDGHRRACKGLPTGIPPQAWDGWVRWWRRWRWRPPPWRVRRRRWWGRRRLRRRCSRTAHRGRGGARLHALAPAPGGDRGTVGRGFGAGGLGCRFAASRAFRFAARGTCAGFAPAGQQSHRSRGLAETRGLQPLAAIRIHDRGQRRGPTRMGGGLPGVPGGNPAQFGEGCPRRGPETRRPGRDFRGGAAGGQLTGSGSRVRQEE